MNCDIVISDGVHERPMSSENQQDLNSDGQPLAATFDETTLTTNSDPDGEWLFQLFTALKRSGLGYKEISISRARRIVIKPAGSGAGSGTTDEFAESAERIEKSF